jgi:hypothetical protein
MVDVSHFLLILKAKRSWKKSVSKIFQDPFSKEVQGSDLNDCAFAIQQIFINFRLYSLDHNLKEEN